MQTDIEHKPKTPRYRVTSAIYEPSRQKVLRYLVGAGLSEKKHLFIHIPKNGGMSIRHSHELKDRVHIVKRNALISHRYAFELHKAMHPKVSVGYGHARLIDINRDLRKASTPFAIIRNPWSRVVSRFTFYKFHNPDGDDFETFLKRRDEELGKEFWWHTAIANWFLQKDHVVDEHGKIGADLLRLEHYDVETREYLNLKQPIEQRNITASKGKSYKDYYNSKTEQLIADWYEEDIRFFGFEFETGATKNTLYTT